MDDEKKNINEPMEDEITEEMLEQLSNNKGDEE